MSIGRNEPCPCGSGRKFKVCCLPLGLKLSSIPELPEEFDLPTRYRELLALGLVSGEGAELACIQAAVDLAGTFCFSPGAENDPALQPCLHVFDELEPLVEENGREEDDLVQLFLPRLPFDVVVDSDGRTCADLLLEQHGASLPDAACEAIRALIEAEDTLCRIDRSGRGLVIEDLRTGTRLPAPEGWRETAPGITCRLVRFRGLHVPLDTMPVDDPSDPWNLASLDEAAEAAGQFLDHLDLKLRSRFKGVAIGEEVLEMALGDDDAEGTEDEDARGGGRGSHA